MGRKHYRRGKHLCFHLACLILLTISGCVTFNNTEQKRDAQLSLALSQELITEGRYMAAVEENMKVLAIFLKGDIHDQA